MKIEFESKFQLGDMVQHKSQDQRSKMVVVTIGIEGNGNVFYGCSWAGFDRRGMGTFTEIELELVEEKE